MSSTSSSDTDQVALLRRAVSGDSEAAHCLARDLGGRAFAQAVRMLGNRAEAEDVAQDALLRLWRVADTWEDRGAQPSTWVYRVVANLCIDRMRRDSPVSLEAETTAEPLDTRPGVETQLQDKARSAALYAALRKLPERQRQAVVLRHIEGLANPDIADMLSVSVEAVESLIARGKRALAGELAERRKELGFYDDET